MTASGFIETAIALAFVFLLFNLLVSTVNEVVLGHLTHLRSRVLAAGLNPLLSNNGDRSPATNNEPQLLVSGVLSSAAPCPQTAQGWWLKCCGLLTTIGAVSQGAPFWFDLLNRLINLRAGGNRPEPDPKPKP